MTDSLPGVAATAKSKKLKALQEQAVTSSSPYRNAATQIRISNDVKPAWVIEAEQDEWTDGDEIGRRFMIVFTFLLGIGALVISGYVLYLALVALITGTY